MGTVEGSDVSGIEGCVSCWVCVEPSGKVSLYGCLSAGGRRGRDDEHTSLPSDSWQAHQRACVIHIFFRMTILRDCIHV